MKKNNVAVSQRGLKRDSKNKARLKRAKALREFNAKVQYVKMIQSLQEKLNKETEPASIAGVYTGTETSTDS